MELKKLENSIRKLKESLKSNSESIKNTKTIQPKSQREKAVSKKRMDKLGGKAKKYKGKILDKPQQAYFGIATYRPSKDSSINSNERSYDDSLERETSINISKDGILNSCREMLDVSLINEKDLNRKSSK
jgi:hypothetical protein